MKSIKARGKVHGKNNVRRLRIGHLSTFYHTAITMMAKPEFLRGVDAEIEWRLFGTGPDIVNAFEMGQIDLAYVGLPPAIIGIDRGVPITCVAGGHMEGTVLSGIKTLTGFPEVSDIKTILKQFHGFKIGVPGKGSIHDVILRHYLEACHAGDDVSVVNFRWADLILEAVGKGEIAAACGTPALSIALKRYASGKILYPPFLLWPNNPSYGILVTRELLTEKTELIGTFLSAHEDVTSFLRRMPLEASQVISDYVGFIDRDFVMDTIMVSPKYCAYLSLEYRSATIDFVKILKQLGYIRHILEEDDIFDMSIIDSIHPPQDHYNDEITTQ
ncbi:MAG: ABC transporter substrate-binding protein [Nitrospiraceae bacterium]|nr:MAG: ABC transporter substrate-binding protein [Nitrospiraceae bacterium]